MFWLALAIIIAAIILAPAPAARSGGYHPRKSNKPIGSPPNCGSGANIRNRKL